MKTFTTEKVFFTDTRNSEAQMLLHEEYYFVLRTQEVMFDNLQQGELYFVIECCHLGNRKYMPFSKQLSCVGS